MVTEEDKRRSALLFRNEIAEVCNKESNSPDECIFLMAKGANFTSQELGTLLSDIDGKSQSKLNEVTYDILTSKVPNEIGKAKFNKLAGKYGL